MRRSYYTLLPVPNVVLGFRASILLYVVDSNAPGRVLLTIIGDS